MNYSPIALFVFNRIDQTIQVIESLKKNKEAIDSTIYIFSDAAKKEEDIEKVCSVRSYVKNITGFKDVIIIERPINFGLSKSILSGVDYILNFSNEIIVLEDDILVSEFFLRYMNSALKKYINTDEVASVCGYMYPVKINLPEVLFLRDPGCWGWGTWKRSWDLLCRDGEKLLSAMLNSPEQKIFNYEGSYNYIGMLEDQISKKNDSWAILWYASLFLREKLTLYPGESLVSNIGFDDSGVHSGKTSQYDVGVLNRSISVADIPIQASEKAYFSIASYYKKNMKIRTRIKNWLKNSLIV